MYSDNNCHIMYYFPEISDLICYTEQYQERHLMITFKISINQTFNGYNVDILPSLNCSRQQHQFTCQKLSSSQIYSVRITKLNYHAETVAVEMFIVQLQGKNTHCTDFNFI